METLCVSNTYNKYVVDYNSQNDIIFIPHIPNEVISNATPKEIGIINILKDIGISNIKTVSLHKTKYNIYNAIITLNYFENNYIGCCIKEIIDIQGYYHISLNNNEFIRLYHSKYYDMKNGILEDTIEDLFDMMNSYQIYISELETNSKNQKNKIKELENKLKVSNTTINIEYNHLLVQLND